jgi:integrase
MNEKKRVAMVRMSRPGERKIEQGRKIELRYADPETKKEVLISTGTLDESEALEQKKTLEAKLLLGIDARPKKRAGGPYMDWQDFRERFRDLHLKTLREDSREASEVRLDVAERIVKPRTLADIANTETLHDLQAKLLEGTESTVGPKDKKRSRGPRSPHTVKSYMVAVLSALNWAKDMEWLQSVPKVRKVKVSKRKQMKGRAICGEEFDKVLAKIKEVVGAEAEPSWKYLLRGLWESSLRIDELMHLHWSDEQYIVPEWNKGKLPELKIPATMQKNDTEESIPLLPSLEHLLLETPKAQRFGWVFNPMSLQTKLGRRVRHQRPNAEWVSKIISRIGAKAGVIVQSAKGAGKPKFASAHDLRRSCAERLATAGVPEREIAKILRHSDVATTRKFYAPGTVQQSAGIIRDKLTVPRNSRKAKST